MIAFFKPNKQNFTFSGKNICLAYVVIYLTVEILAVMYMTNSIQKQISYL